MNKLDELKPTQGYSQRNSTYILFLPSCMCVLKLHFSDTETDNWKPFHLAPWRRQRLHGPAQNSQAGVRYWSLRQLLWFSFAHFVEARTLGGTWERHHGHVKNTLCHTLHFPWKNQLFLKQNCHSLSATGLYSLFNLLSTGFLGIRIWGCSP